MSVNLVNLVRDYAGIEDPVEEPVKVTSPGLNEINASLVQCFYGITWEKVDVLKQGIFKMTGRASREVYMSREAGLVAKLDSCFRRKTRFVDIPYAEQITSEIGKLFGWSEIPETVVIHETDYALPQYKKYQPLMQCFIQNGVKDKCPITFTFQSLVNGKTLPTEILQWPKWKNENLKVSTLSYHKAFLLVLLLAKNDAHGANSMLDPETGLIYEIDNEKIGCANYDINGVLHHFTALKSEIISKNILSDFLKVKPDVFVRLRNKYIKKDLHLSSLWAKEKIPHLYNKLENNLIEIWDGISLRLLTMQETCRSLMEKGEPVTLIKIEEELDKVSGDEDLTDIRKSARLFDEQRLKAYFSENPAD
jgi:hypothetical protein